MPQWYLGTIGFGYKDWIGTFYPSRIKQKELLPYYSKVFNTVELDTTFHAIPRKTIVQAWAAVTGIGFKFCPKTPRLITHELGLTGAQGLMQEFLDSLSPLKDKLGPILIQLPPRYTHENLPGLVNFLENMPQAYKLAIEFRHPSWYNPKTSELLAQYKVCWVSSEFPNLPKEIIPTTDFLYIRWIGVNGTYKQHTHERIDKTVQLKWWLKIIQPFSDTNLPVYGFFNNDYAGNAAHTCNRFKSIVGLPVAEPQTSNQERLF